MATRSNIGMIQEDGTIRAIYCHWDGYPEGVGETLQTHYSTPEQVRELLNVGDISSLCDTIEETRASAYARRGDADTQARTYKDEEEWSESARSSSAEFIYLYRRTLYGAPGWEWEYKEISNYWKTVPTKKVQTV